MEVIANRSVIMQVGTWTTGWTGTIVHADKDFKFEMVAVPNHPKNYMLCLYDNDKEWGGYVDSFWGHIFEINQFLSESFGTPIVLKEPK